jgi:hypothetical protein
MWSKRHALAEIVAIVGFLLLLPRDFEHSRDAQSAVR